MDLLLSFKNNLLNGRQKASNVTVKNYLADVRKFIMWYESLYKSAFNPQVITANIISDYVKTLSATTSPLSLKRYQSSLRKFFSYLKDTKQIEASPFEQSTQESGLPKDPWKMDEFKHFLYTSKASKLTVKNYLADVRQFKDWLEKVTPVNLVITESGIVNTIGEQTIKEYRDRLLYDAKMSPVSINRKLSALRKYIQWAYAQNLISQTIPGIERIETAKAILPQIIPSPVKTEELPLEALKDLPQDILEEKDEEDIKEQYSRFAPVRLAQKIKKGMVYVLDGIFINPVAKLVEQTKYAYWKLRGRKVFASVNEIAGIKSEKQPLTTASISKTATKIAKENLIETFIKSFTTSHIIKLRNLPKSLYAPLAISTKGFTWYQKILYHMLHTRPAWYKKYHTFNAVHYFHFAVLAIFIIVSGFTLYNGLVEGPKHKQPVLASLPSSPPRLISFTGKLTDATDSPLTAETPLRFAIYKNQTSSGSAMLWQEVQGVTPKEDGSFTVLLGRNSTLTQNLFTENPSLFLGITVATGEEMMPRQQLTTVSYAADAQMLQGKKVISDPDAGTENVILALDSSGDLTIGGSASPTFQATGGEFTLSGQTLTLTTNAGSNGNLQFRPDGSGIIDMQKAIQNTTDNNYGAVTIDDMLAITSKNGSSSALQIEQNGTGALISASTNDFAKFTVDNNGNGMYAGNVQINGNYLTSTSTTFNLFNDSTYTLNIGGEASSISLGATTGTTTINNTLEALGGIKLAAGQKLTLEDFAPGTIPFIDSNKQLAYDNTGLYWDAVNSRMGLGTTAPDYKLSVQDTKALTSVAQIYNTDAGADADGLSIKLGNTSSTVANTNNFITFQTSGLGNVGMIRGNGSNGITIQQTGIADFAEYFKKDRNQPIPFGALICLGVSGNVFPCTEEGGTIIGISSEHPAFLAGEDLGDGSIPVGLTGLVKTNVSAKNGEIKPGDMITSSDIAGVGIKATKPGMVVGRAIEGFKSDDSAAIGQVLVTIHPSWYSDANEIAANGSLSVNGENMGPKEEKTDQSLSLEQLAYTIIDNIQSGTDQVTSGAKTQGDSLKTYIAGVVEDVIKGKTIEKAFAKQNEARVLITPLASSSAMAVALDNDGLKLFANKEATGSAVASIDKSGNATLSGSLSATDASLSGNLLANSILGNNASIAGTLRAGRIIADEIEFSDNALDRILARANGRASQSANIATISATPTPALAQAPIATPAANTSSEAAEFAKTITVHPVTLTKFADIASFSAELAYVPNLQSDFATFNQGFVALGPSSMTDVGVSNQIQIGKNMVLAASSIDTIGSDLELQPLRQGNLSVMGGLVAIDTNGNLDVKGNATFAQNVTIHGQLAASGITSLPGQDVKVNLGSDSAESKLAVNNKDGQNVVSINGLGDVIASGSGQFMNLAAGALNIIRGAQADTSLTETVANGSAGSAVISANETERTIFTPFVKKDSLIYITATSNTYGALPYIARQMEENPSRKTKGSFTIQIPTRVTKDIKINWWIVN